MKDEKTKPSPPNEPSAFERMKEFTRRLVSVPKSELARNARKQPGTKK